MPTLFSPRCTGRASELLYSLGGKPCKPFLRPGTHQDQPRLSTLPGPHSPALCWPWARAASTKQEANAYCQELKHTRQVRCEQSVRKGLLIHSSQRELWGSQLDRDAPAHTSVQRGVTHPAAGAWLGLRRFRRMPNLLFPAFSLPLPLCQVHRASRTTESQRETVAPTSLGAPWEALALRSKPLSS